MTASSDVAKPGWQDEKGNQIGYSHQVQNYKPGVNMSAPLQSISDRGQARGDQAQGTLGAYGQSATQYGANASSYGGKAYDMGTSGSTQAYQAGQRLEGAGGQGGAIGSQYAGAIGNAGGMGMGEAYAAQQRLGQSADRMTGAADRLSNLENTQGPSAAQAQLQSGLNRAQANNLAMARSGSGFGGSASRSTQALRQNAAMGQDAANSSAMLKASEDAAWRQRQAGNLGVAGGLYGGAGNLGAASGQLGLSATGQNLQAQGMAGQQALAGNAQRLQGIQGSGQLGLQGTALGMQGAQQGVQANQAGIQGVQAGGALQAQGFGLGMQGDQQAGQAIAQDQAAKQAYEQMLMQEYGIESGVGVQQAASTNAFYGGVVGGVAGAAGMMSDERQKKVGPQVKMSSAIFGNPYGRRGAPGHMMSESDPAGTAPGTGDWVKGEEIRDPASEDGRMLSPEQKHEMLNRMADPYGSSVAYSAAQPAQDRTTRIVQNRFLAPDQKSALLRGGEGGFSPYEVMSDERQKQAPSLRDVPSSLYEYKDPSLPGAQPGLQAGPMAQDIERAIPGAVHDTPYGKQVDPGRTVLPLLSAVGEQQARIDKLEQRLGETPDRRLAENERPKGEGRTVSDAPSGLSFEAYDAKGYGAPDPQSQAPSTTPGATMARRAVGTLGNALMEPVKMGARALRNVVDTRAIRNLDANEAIDQGESLVRDEPVAATRARRRAGEHAYGDWAAAGDVAGEIGAAGVQGAALKAAPAVEAEAARAFGGSKASQRGMVEFPVSDSRLGDVQNFLNRDRAASSFYERNGYEATVERFGKERADDVVRTTEATQAALGDAAASGGAPSTVYRGAHMTPQEIEALSREGAYRNPSIWSTATAKERAEGFASKMEPGKEPVLFKIRERSAVGADAIPESNTFEEALIPKGREFKVGAHSKGEARGKPVRIIELMER